MCVCVCMCVCVRVYVRVCAYVCVCMHVLTLTSWLGSHRRDSGGLLSGSRRGNVGCKQKTKHHLIGAQQLYSIACILVCYNVWALWIVKIEKITN